MNCVHWYNKLKLFYVILFLFPLHTLLLLCQAQDSYRLQTFLGKKENLLNCYQYVIHTYICDFLANIYNTVIKLNHYFCVKLAYYFKAFTNHQKKSPSVTVPFDLVKTKIKYQGLKRKKKRRKKRKRKKEKRKKEKKERKKRKAARGGFSAF